MIILKRGLEAVLDVHWKWGCRVKRDIKGRHSKEVVAFANTSGGTIYVGIDNDGNELGVQDVDKHIRA